jgi:ParB family transcriptional regulator, chromosome partitioning protein
MADDKAKAGTEEKPKAGIRRALGRGLESLLPSTPLAGNPPIGAGTAGARPANPGATGSGVTSGDSAIGSSSTATAAGEAEVRILLGDLEAGAAGAKPTGPSTATGAGSASGIQARTGTGSEATAKVEAGPEVAAIFLPIALIDRNPYQTRLAVNEERVQELAASIAEIGVMTPIVVRPVQGGRYVIIAGERRWMASKAAGKETIPAVVRAVADADALVMTVTENLQRQDLNPMEQARAFDRMAREFHFEHKDIAAKVGINRSSVTNYLRMLKLPADVLEQVAQGKLTMGHAKALLALSPDSGPNEMAKEYYGKEYEGHMRDVAVKNAETISSVAFKVVNSELSVRKTEALVNAILLGDKDPREMAVPPPIDPNVKDAQEKLQSVLGLKVVIEDRNGRGKVVIAYSNLDDFEALMDSFGSKGR